MTTEKNPIDHHLDNILKVSGTTLANFETSAGALQGMRAALLAAVAELAPAGAASANHFPDAAKMVVELSDEQIKAILLGVGYTIKPGLTDLKPYVYVGARALLAAAPQPPTAHLAPDHFPDAAKMMAGDAAMKTALIDGAQLWVRQVDTQAALAAKDAEIARLRDEDEINTDTINRLSHLLAEVAIAVKGDEQPLKRHGWADIAELVQKGMLELELYRFNAPELQKRIDSSAQLIRNLEARNSGLATDLAAARQHLPAQAPAFSVVAAGKLAELQARGFVVSGVSIEKAEVDGRVTRGFVTHGGFVGWWAPEDGAQAGPVLLTDERVRQAGGIVHRDGNVFFTNVEHLNRAMLAAVHAANPVPANLEWSKGGEITPIDERVQRSRAAFYALQKDAERYRLVRRGQHWSVIDGAGDALRAEELDVAADAVISKAAGQEGGAS